MTDPVDLALLGFRTVISNLSPTGKPPLNAAYVYPFPDHAWRQQFEAAQLPIGIISQVVGEPNTIDTLAAGQLRHKWRIVFRLLLRRGKLNDSELDQEIAELHNAYVNATAVLLAGNSTLGGTIALLGDGRGGRLIEPTIGHMSWLNTEYWGVQFIIPIQQVIAATMAA